MKIRQIAWTLSILFTSGSAFAAPVAKVLALAGDAYVTRAGQESRLTLGAPIENGDSLRVADASVLQVRFVDDSIISLRANSVFKIEDFAHERNPQTDRSIFGLIRGGLRTITGLIGRENRANYAVRGATATIGIRGTHYTIVSCTAEAACVNPDGTTAPEGMYGGVTDGRIAVTNDAGEFQFAQQEYFRLAGRTEQPERLLAPPSFLGAGFEAAARGRQRGVSARSAVAAGRNADDGGNNPEASNSPQTTTLASPMDALPAGTLAYAPANNPTVAGGTPVPAQSPIVAGDGKSPSATTGLLTLFAASNPADTTQHYAGTNNFSTVQWTDTGFQKASNDANNYVDRGTAATADRGADGGVIEWGRWVGGPTSAGGWGNNLSFSTTQGMHYLVGAPTASMPTNGVGIAYSLLGATSPTFSDGSGSGLGLGKVTGGSTLVNFLTRNLSGSFDLAFAAGNTYKLALDGTFSGSSVAGSGTMLRTAGSTDVCGANGCVGTVSGFFAGDAASYLGLGYDLRTNTTTPLSLNGVIALNRTGALPQIYTATGTYYESLNNIGIGLKTGGIRSSYVDGGYYTQNIFNNFQLPTGLTTYTGIMDFLVNAIGPYPDLNQAGAYKTKAASTNLGSASTSEGTINWGRFQESVANSTLPAENALYFEHWATGPVVSSLPTVGNFVFSYLGGTQPTDQSGNVGNVVSGGSWAVNFANRTLQSATPLQWTMPGGINYTLNVTSPLSWSTSTSPTEIQTSPNNGTLTTNETKVNTLTGSFVSCSGCSMNGAWLSPQFMGATGTGLSMGVKTSAIVGGSEQLTGQVQVYGNPAPIPANITYVFSENETRAGATTVNAYPNAPVTTYTTFNNGAHNALIAVSQDAVFPVGMPTTPLDERLGWYSTTSSQTVGNVTTTITYTKDASVDNGSTVTGEGTYYWGHYTRQLVTSTSMPGPYPAATTTETDLAHWSYGPVVSSLPTTGTFTFTSIGGTRPTDHAGNIASVSNAGSWSVNFSNQTLMSASPVLWSMPNGTSYELHVTSPLSWAPTAPSTSVTPLTVGTLTKTSSSISSISATPYLACFPSCSVLDAKLSPQFGGATATGLSMGISTNALTQSGQQTTAQVQIYKR